MTDFVSGAYRPEEDARYKPAPLKESVKTLEACVKGYGARGTPASRARDDAIMGESREDPWAGWYPVMSAEEQLTARLEHVVLTDTTNAVQLPLPL